MPSPTLQALVEAAVEVSGADRGWLVAGGRQGDLMALAVAGPGGPATLPGPIRGPAGAVPWVLASGQPAALRPAAGEAIGAGGLGDAGPSRLLCVPCPAGDDVVAALEVVDSRDGATAPFTIDDVEVVTLLGTVAGPAVLELGGTTPPARPAAELAADLAGLSAADPARYAVVAQALDALLG